MYNILWGKKLTGLLDVAEFVIVCIISKPNNFIFGLKIEKIYGEVEGLYELLDLRASINPVPHASAVFLSASISSQFLRPSDSKETEIT